MHPLLYLLIPVALAGAVFGALATAADAALLSISRGALERSTEDRPERQRRRVLRVHEDVARTIAALTLGRVFAEATMAVSITAMLFESLEGLVVPGLLALLISGALSFIAVSVSPRTLGRRRPTEVLVGLSGLLSFTRVVLGPLAALLVHIGSAFTPGGRVDGGPYAAEAELRESVDRALENEQLEISKRDMIHGVFDLGETRVRELMVPRTDMITIDSGATAQVAMRLFVRSGFSRVPVVGEDPDDVLGMLYQKDTTRAIHSPWNPREDQPVTEIMRTALFYPELLPAGEVLRQMQTSRRHIGMVVDEYGGVSGLVTIEDIIEEIVGDISDEHDRSEPEIEDLGDGRFRVPARESISSVGELFGLDIDDEDVDTIGGLLAKQIGRVPILGSSADALGLHIEAERTHGRRKQLSTVLITRADPDSREHRGEDAEEAEENHG